MSMSLFLFCKQGHLYNFSRFHIYALIYNICFFLSDLLHSIWRSLGPSMSLQMTQLHSVLWLSNIPWYIHHGGKRWGEKLGDWDWHTYSVDTVHKIDNERKYTVYNRRLYSTLCSDLNRRETRKGGDICTGKVDSFSHAVEANTTLWSKYTAIKINFKNTSYC